MKYSDAVKQVQAEKPKDNYMIIEIGYGNSLVLSHKAGLEFLQSLAQVEHMDNSYSSDKHIKPLAHDVIKVSTLSHQDYARYKTATLLGISVSELERAEEEELQGAADGLPKTA